MFFAGETISTVGVDIGDLTFEKMKSNRGKVTFKTWDFGGQVRLSLHWTLVIAVIDAGLKI